MVGKEIIENLKLVFMYCNNATLPFDYLIEKHLN